MQGAAAFRREIDGFKVGAMLPDGKGASEIGLPTVQIAGLAA
jgi:hypothetical protein